MWENHWPCPTAFLTFFSKRITGMANLDRQRVCLAGGISCWSLEASFTHSLATGQTVNQDSSSVRDIHCTCPGRLRIVGLVDIECNFFSCMLINYVGKYITKLIPCLWNTSLPLSFLQLSLHDNQLWRVVRAQLAHLVVNKLQKKIIRNSELMGHL